MKPRPNADLQQEVADLRSQAWDLKRSNNQLIQVSKLQKVKEQKLLDELKQAVRSSEKRGVGSKPTSGKERELDEFAQSMEEENSKLRRRNLLLQEQLRKISNGGVKTPRSMRVVKRPRSRKENRTTFQEEAVQQMLDRIGEKLNVSEMVKAHGATPPAPPTAKPDEIEKLKARLGQSQAKVAILEHQYEQIDAAMQAGKQVHRQAVEQVDKYKALLADAHSRNRVAQQKVQQLEIFREKSDSMSLIIDDLQATNANLQNQVNILTKTAFLGDEAESRRLHAIERDHLSQINDLRSILAEREQILSSNTEKLTGQLEKIQKLEENLQTESNEKRKIQQENSKLLARLQSVEDRIHVFTADSGVELEELDRALDMVRRQKPLNGSSASSAPITIPALQRQIRELEIGHKDLVTELRGKTDLLRLQTHLNCELDAEVNRLQSENRHLKQSIYNGQRQAASSHRRADSVISDVSLLSQLSSLSFTGNHNMIVIRVAGAQLRQDAVVFRDQPDPLTFVAVDFFDYESCYSGVFGGLNPQYKLTAQYKANTDGFLIEHLKTETFKVDLYRQSGIGQVDCIGSCRVPLRDLVSYARKIRRSVDCVDITDSSTIVATIDIVCKMYRPIVSVAPSQCPSVVGDPVAPEPYSMRMTITLNNLTLDDQEPVADLQDINLRAHNMYYNLTKLFEKVTTSKNSKALGTFAIEFETKHDRLLPYELIQLDMIREHMDQEQLIGHFDLVLAQVAQATSGQVETTMELKDSSDKTIGKSDVSVEWIISECVR